MLRVFTYVQMNEHINKGEKNLIAHTADRCLSTQPHHMHQQACIMKLYAIYVFSLNAVNCIQIVSNFVSTIARSVSVQ